MSTEIIGLSTDASRLPQRQTRQKSETADARLLRTIAAALPVDFLPVSQIGVETSLEAMAEAAKVAIAADLDCFLAWCAPENRSAFPASPEDLVGYLRHLEAQGRKPATLARRMASLARAYRLVGLGEDTSLPTEHTMVRNARRASPPQGCGPASSRAAASGRRLWGTCGLHALHTAGRVR